MQEYLAIRLPSEGCADERKHGSLNSEHQTHAAPEMDAPYVAEKPPWWTWSLKGLRGLGGVLGTSSGAKGKPRGSFRWMTIKRGIEGGPLSARL